LQKGQGGDYDPIETAFGAIDPSRSATQRTPLEELKGYSWVDQLMGAVKAVEQFCRSRSPRKTRWLVPLA